MAGPPAEPATTARPTTSYSAFLTGDGMPEGRWASSCSLTCILPGGNVSRTLLDESFEFGADVCVAHVSDEAANIGPGNATRASHFSFLRALSTLNTERRFSAGCRPSAGGGVTSAHQPSARLASPADVCSEMLGCSRARPARVRARVLVLPCGS